MTHSHSKKAFTLIELLVVIAIIAILAAILFPVFAQAKTAAKKTASLSNQKQIGTAVILYSGDYDDMLPETGWQGPCSFPGSTTPANDEWSGVHPFLTGIHPYMKNWDIISCPADPDKGVFGKTGELCFEKFMLDANVPGAYVGMADVPNSSLEMSRILPASYGGNYLLMPSYNGTNTANYATQQLGAWTGQRGQNMSVIESPANMFYSTDVGSARTATTNFAGWYIVPGYGLTTSAGDRWKKGQRHNGGRNWTFADGHAKYHRDPSYTNADGTNKSSRQLIWDYQQRGVWTYWETTSDNYCQWPSAEAGCRRYSPGN